MTSQAAPQGGPRGRVTSWLVHRQFLALTIALPFSVASAIVKALALDITSLAMMAVLMFSALLQIRHDRGLCERCLSDMPLDGPAEAGRKARTLRGYHLITTWTLRIVLVAGAVQVLANQQRSVVAAASGLGMTLLAVQAWTAYVHRPLQPWCHDCGWGDDGDDGDEPVDDPLPVIESTKTRTG